MNYRNELNIKATDLANPKIYNISFTTQNFYLSSITDEYDCVNLGYQPSVMLKNDTQYDWVYSYDKITSFKEVEGVVTEYKTENSTVTPNIIGVGESATFNNISQLYVYRVSGVNDFEIKSDNEPRFLVNASMYFPESGYHEVESSCETYVTYAHVETRHINFDVVVGGYDVYDTNIKPTKIDFTVTSDLKYKDWSWGDINVSVFGNSPYTVECPIANETTFTTFYNSHGNDTDDAGDSRPLLGTFSVTVYINDTSYTLTKTITRGDNGTDLINDGINVSFYVTKDGIEEV